MNYLLVNCHPYKQSFNYNALQSIKQTLTQKGESVEFIDLITDNFNPVMQEEDLKMWGQGTFCDPLVGGYQQQIAAADMIIFSFPIWWGAMPAALKGFCEKVFLPSWAYKYDDKGQMVGLLKGKKAVVITTMQTATEIYNGYFNNPIEGAFIKDTLQSCGVEVIRFMQIDQIVSGGNEHTTNKINEIISLFD